MLRKFTIPIRKIPENAVLAEDIVDNYNTMLLTAGSKLSTANISLLHKYDIQHVAVLLDEAQATTVGNIEITDNNIIDSDLKLSMLDGVENIFSEQKNIKIQMDKLETVVRSVVERLSKQKNLLIHLNNNHENSDDLFLHCVNVSLFSIALGITMELPLEDTCVLGVGGLLHDIGKVNIPSEIINKPGRLTIDEFEHVKKHVTFGYNSIKQEKNLDHRIPLIVLQHHERCNGQGYPWGIIENQIHPLAQIVAVTDAYEALTANRAFRSRFTAEKAIAMVNEHAGLQFSTPVLDAFNKIVVPYNIGETVQLSNGITGKVIRLNRADLHRPQVFTQRGKIDLLQNPDMRIECALNV